MSAGQTHAEPHLATFLLPTRAETAAWGEALGARLRAGDVVALLGDLGTGKTTLTQAVARGLGVTEPVSSPTFTLVQEYRGRVPLFHFDPYRLERSEDMVDLGFEEYLERGGVVVVEWADKLGDLLPTDRLTLGLELPAVGSAPDFEAEDAPRLLTAVPGSLRWEGLLAQLQALPEIAALRALAEVRR
ncbi:MAG TPA: tRNA (adenosine(37)-N6)-threonylcarbamoyltransferase complex ATPase subunit type 1 TsaE [Chthonomonadaceae bacterium]|nr:tRNA (adenosine(37)-N6)-threonylcarbamoyltransferase complex ATPase subunit type 1 TsaE [Chthonomonadaceae bacterium]